ncbi:glypican-5-like [Ornithodoros turicata]|uniref:glypican-5-like n=1 Tax=Ornithodoros turicata TaxID=34597 RepID=UPI00313982F9
MTTACGLLFVLLLCAASLVRSDARLNGKVDLTSCSEVRELFSTNLRGDEVSTDLVPESKISGASLSICRSGQSCCTPAAEQELHRWSIQRFRVLLRGTTTTLVDFLRDSATSLKESFRHMLSQAEHNTMLLFSNVYTQRMEAATREPVRRLFSALQHYLLPHHTGDHKAGHHKAQEEIDLDGELDRFFDHLFPLVYFHTVNPKLNDFSEDYKACLRGAQRQLRPFGDVPNRIQERLSKSLSGARTVLRVALGAQEVVTTAGMFPDTAAESCAYAITRTIGCQVCGGFPKALPCRGLCLNTFRGCLAGVYELDEPWDELVTGLGRLVPRLADFHDPEDVLSKLDSRISEAVMHAMENGPELLKRVKLECGDPRRRTGNATSDEQRSPRWASPSSLRAPAETLRTRLRHLYTQLTHSKDIFSTLADKMCFNESVTATDANACWNGRRFAKYRKKVEPATSRFNAEVNHTATLWDSELDVAAEKLRAVTKEVLTNRITMMPESDSYTMEGSGSGSGAWVHGGVTDDEDFNGGSGSGHGEGSMPSENPRKLDVPTTPPPKTASSSTATAGSMAVVLLLAYFTLRLGSTQ